MGACCNFNHVSVSTNAPYCYEYLIRLKFHYATNIATCYECLILLRTSQFTAWYLHYSWCWDQSGSYTGRTRYGQSWPEPWLRSKDKLLSPRRSPPGLQDQRHLGVCCEWMLSGCRSTCSSCCLASSRIVAGRWEGDRDIEVYSIWVIILRNSVTCHWLAICCGIIKLK